MCEKMQELREKILGIAKLQCLVFSQKAKMKTMTNFFLGIHFPKNNGVALTVLFRSLRRGRKEKKAFFSETRFKWFSQI